MDVEVAPANGLILDPLGIQVDGHHSTYSRDVVSNPVEPRASVTASDAGRRCFFELELVLTT